MDEASLLAWMRINGAAQQPQVNMPSSLFLPPPQQQLYANMVYQLFLQQQLQMQQQQKIFQRQFTMPQPVIPECVPTPSTSSYRAMLIKEEPQSPPPHQHAAPIEPIIAVPKPIKIQDTVKEEPISPVFRRTIELLLTPDATPSPALAAQKLEETRHSSSPTSESTRQSREEEDEDEQLFIDVEDLEDKESGKNKRKAHIEFYRKVKQFRNRPDKTLQCATCEEEIVNNDASITEHVQTHAKTMSFRCQICGAEATNRTQMYTHMNEKHPKKPTAFSDRRDMLKLSGLISECFPKTQPKVVKSSLVTYIDQVVGSLAQKKITELTCQICQKKVPGQRSALMKHMQLHPAYRCKLCKYTSSTTGEQEDHSRLFHKITDPKLQQHYNLCTALDVVTKNFQRCFGDLAAV
ncbi:unnamed protein product, partial [Mesorhabditis spiculigera]